MRCVPRWPVIRTWRRASRPVRRARAVIPADPETPWQLVELDPGVDVEEQLQRVCAAERAAVCDFTNGPAFRVALIRIAEDRHRFVLTNHHIVIDGWSLPVLLQEIFASYFGQRLPAPVPYRRFVTWLADQDLGAARAAWRESSMVSTRQPWRDRPAAKRLALEAWNRA